MKKHSLNNILLLSFFYMSSCVSIDDTAVKPITNMKWNEQFDSCRGKGKLVSSGPIQGTLTFIFTCAEENVFIQFNDLLGRKVLLMNITENDVEAWDIFQNVKFSKESIYERFPFFEIIKPADLYLIFWGVEPNQFHEKNPLISNTILKMTFTGNDHGIQTVELHTDETQNIQLVFENREFGSSYPHLIRKFPETIPAI